MKILLLFVNNLFEAFCGAISWLKIKSRYHIKNNNPIIIIPSCDNMLNQCIYKYLNSFIEMKKCKQVYILRNNKSEDTDYILSSDCSIKLINLSEKKCNHIIRYYCIRKFNNNVIIASLDKPSGRAGYELIKPGRLTLDEVVTMGLYGFKEYEHID